MNASDPEAGLPVRATARVGRFPLPLVACIISDASDQRERVILSER